MSYSSYSFNEEFCIQLEYHLCRTFERADLRDIKCLWCDGISSAPFLEKQLTIDSVLRTHEIVSTAWIGKAGQDEYEMTIHFGEHALICYENGSSLVDCIPGPDTMDWIEIDTEKHTIEIALK